MSADSSRKLQKQANTGQVILPQTVSDPSIIESVAGFIHEVVPQAYSSVLPGDARESILWARFEYCDYNDPENYPPTTECESEAIPPLLLVLGYGLGVQVWSITGSGEATEVLSWSQGSVRTLRLLCGPKDSQQDPLAKKRPLVAIVDSAGPGPQFCTLNFISLRTGAVVKSIKFKTPVCDVYCNKKSVVVTFAERIAVFDVMTLEDRLTITTCYLSPGMNQNPVALGPRWLAYAEKRLTTWQRSSGGCEGEGGQSYTATVIHAAKSLGKGLRDLSGSLTGNVSQPATPSSAEPGIVTIVDIETKAMKEDCAENIIAHFVGHLGPIVAMTFDPSGLLLVTADKHGHRFHVFRIHPHPCGPALAAVHHLYILHRGDTTARVQDIAVSWDSRWVAVSSVRGTTHVFPITPYGGPVAVRTHTTPHVVNRLSRFERSAGLSDGRGSPVGEAPCCPTNPRLPPYPHPTPLSPLAQLRRWGSHLPPAPVEEAAVRLAAAFAQPRAWVPGRPRSKRPLVESLFVMASHGNLIQYDLDPRCIAGVPKDKISYDTGIELGVEAKAEWVLLRPPYSSAIQPPLNPSNPLLCPFKAQEAGPRHNEDRWLSQVEIITHTGPHRRLWMGPQFSFKTIDPVPPGSILESEDQQSESIPVRSNPVNMPHRPYLLIESGSGGSVESPHMADYSEDGDESVHRESRLREDLADAMLDTGTHGSGLVGGGRMRGAVLERQVNPMGTVVTLKTPPETRKVPIDSQPVPDVSCPPVGAKLNFIQESVSSEDPSKCQRNAPQRATEPVQVEHAAQPPPDQNRNGRKKIKDRRPEPPKTPGSRKVDEEIKETAKSEPAEKISKNESPSSSNSPPDPALQNKNNKTKNKKKDKVEKLASKDLKSSDENENLPQEKKVQSEFKPDAQQCWSSIINPSNGQTSKEIQENASAESAQDSIKNEEPEVVKKKKRSKLSPKAEPEPVIEASKNENPMPKEETDELNDQKENLLLEMDFEFEKPDQAVEEIGNKMLENKDEEMMEQLEVMEFEPSSEENILKVAEISLKRPSDSDLTLPLSLESPKKQTLDREIVPLVSGTLDMCESPPKEKSLEKEPDILNMSEKRKKRKMSKLAQFVNSSTENNESLNLVKTPSDPLLAVSAKADEIEAPISIRKTNKDKIDLPENENIEDVKPEKESEDKLKVDQIDIDEVSLSEALKELAQFPEIKKEAKQTEVETPIETFSKKRGRRKKGLLNSEKSEDILDVTASTKSIVTESTEDAGMLEKTEPEPKNIWEIRKMKRNKNGKNNESAMEPKIFDSELKQPEIEIIKLESQNIIIPEIIESIEPERAEDKAGLKPESIDKEPEFESIPKVEKTKKGKKIKEGSKNERKDQIPILVSIEEPKECEQEGALICLDSENSAKESSEIETTAITKEPIIDLICKVELDEEKFPVLNVEKTNSEEKVELQVKMELTESLEMRKSKKERLKKSKGLEISEMKIKEGTKSKSVSPAKGDPKLDSTDSSDEANCKNSEAKMISQRLAKRKKGGKKAEEETQAIKKTSPRSKSKSDSPLDTERSDYETCSEKKSDSSIESFPASLEKKAEDSNGNIPEGKSWSSVVKHNKEKEVVRTVNSSEDKDSVYESCNDDEFPAPEQNLTETLAFESSKEDFEDQSQEKTESSSTEEKPRTEPSDSPVLQQLSKKSRKQKRKKR